MNTRMNPEIKAQWVERLRSGAYEQGEGYLHLPAHGSNPERYCCLGVLCEIAVEKGVVESNLGNLGYSYTEPGADWNQERVLPRAVAAWAGLDRPQPYAGGECLTTMNDSGMSFSKIADHIEEHL